jgi:hypothetical protein
MAPSRVRAPSSHARLHKRGSSASSITSPSALSPLSSAQAFTFNRSETPKVTYEEPWNESPSHPMPAAASSTPLKIKPYLRKLSSNSKSLDLSRPAAENEGLAGLGISEYGSYSHSSSDITFNNGRNRHARSTSNNSQYSTSSSLHRPTAPYMPPIRQTPHPYTPPISKSTPPSVLGSDNDMPTDMMMTDEELRLRQQVYPARRSGSISSVPVAAPALRIHTAGSSTRLAGSYSQSSVSLTSPVAQSRPRGDTLVSMDSATSPSSRTSFDKISGLMRTGRDSPVDAASRAASIRAARHAFNEKEMAKERKQDKEASKQAQREHKKLYRKEEQQRRKSDVTDVTEHKRSRSVSTSSEKNSRPSVAGTQYSDYRQSHTRSLPALVPIIDEEKQSDLHPKVTKSRAAKSRWLRLVTWLKTRLLRMSSHRVHSSA